MSASTDYMKYMVKMKILPTLVIGVTLLRVAPCLGNDQSEFVLPDEQPIGMKENIGGQRRMETPEVVLQLKYDGGELNKIYLAQFRKETPPWIPSVPVRSNLCADLCHAGLGGDVCGPACPQMIPVGLRTALRSSNQTDVMYGQPRVSVCPTLCDNHLGSPLCGCASTEHDDIAKIVDWPAICAAFCLDGYVLGGCPACGTTASPTDAMTADYSRVLNTSEGWSAWCNVQCHQGQGGAACNCDRAPFQ